MQPSMNADEWPGFSISEPRISPPDGKTLFFVFFSMKMNLTVPFSEFLDVAATFPFVARVLCLEFHFKNLWKFRESTPSHFLFSPQKPPKKKKLQRGVRSCPSVHRLGFLTACPAIRTLPCLAPPLSTPPPSLHRVDVQRTYCFTEAQRKLINCIKCNSRN